MPAFPWIKEKLLSPVEGENLISCSGIQEFLNHLSTGPSLSVFTHPIAYNSRIMLLAALQTLRQFKSREGVSAGGAAYRWMLLDRRSL